MGIQNFPAALQPIIQQNMLEREFHQALRSRLAYRQIADREAFSGNAGETLTKTRAGLKPTIKIPLAASTNTNLDNGLTPNGWAIEQYSLTINQYGDTLDLNTVTSRVGIVSQFLQNAYVNGEQAARSMDELARNALFQSYGGGNTRVRVTGTLQPVVQVDDVRGFVQAPVNGVMTAISAGNQLTVVVGANTYTLNTAVADGVQTAAQVVAGSIAPIGMTFSGASVNSSTTPGGFSGALTFSANVLVADQTIGATVTAPNAPSVIRPSGRGNTSLLTAADALTMGNLLDAVAQLRLNNIPEVNGAYNCYLDPKSARQLFADPDFKQLFQGTTSATPVFKAGLVNDFLGLRFMPTTEAYTQTLAGVGTVRRPIICGQGALIEGGFSDIAHTDVTPADSIISMVDGVAMVTREPLDRLQQIVAQSWYWIGGYCTPSDVTTNSTTLPTATNATFKRAVMIEHIG